MARFLHMHIHTHADIDIGIDTNYIVMAIDIICMGFN